MMRRMGCHSLGMSWSSEGKRRSAPDSFNSGTRTDAGAPQTSSPTNRIRSSALVRVTTPSRIL